ncbi:MAG: hypothetical protein EXS15_07440 [Phycisphaerales bacterium]|nr:hypothetical protein [Phycisphaerales bacterium]
MIKPRAVSLMVGAAVVCAATIGAIQQQPTDYNAKFDAWLATPNEPARVTPRIIKRTYEWLDATPSITTRHGVKYRNPSIAPWRFTIVASIDQALAESIEKHFGVVMESIQFGFTSEAEKTRLQRLEKAKLAHHGMLVTPSKDGTVGILEADYQWLVAGCANSVRPIAESILRETDRVLQESDAPRIATARDRIAAIFRFIQSIPYETIPDAPDGKDRCGMRTPLITLLKGGDCDSKSALMAALIRSKKIAHTIIITLHMKDGTGHAIIGVCVDVQGGDQTLTYKGKVYVLAEAASSDLAHNGVLADLGEVGPDSKDFQSRPFDVIPLK